MSEESDEMFDPESEDPTTKERAACMAKNCSVRKVYNRLDECKKRVESKDYTAETCHEEMVDLMEAVDNCVKSKAFLKLA